MFAKVKLPEYSLIGAENEENPSSAKIMIKREYYAKPCNAVERANEPIKYRFDA